MKDDELLFDGPRDAKSTIVLAHGAGAPMDSTFMNVVAKGLAQAGIRVVRFEFLYMRARRTEKKRPGPDRQPALLARWREVVEHLGGGEKLVIGGKSMGGRIASYVADDVRARGLVCMGYPFHPPGNPAKLRTAHLADLKTPALIVQGERDAFGTREEIVGYALSKSIHVELLPFGDHSWKPPKKSGRTEAQNLADGIAVTRDFVLGLR